MDLPELSGERLDLVSLDEAGLDDMFEYSKMPEFYRFMAELDVQKTLEDTQQYLKKLIKRSDSAEGHYWFIRHRSDNKIIGTCGLLNFDRNRNSIEIGYGLSPHYWGHGYFQEVLAITLNFCFSKLNLHRVWAKTQADNAPSISALCRTGFKQEGIMRDYYRSSHDGKYYDAALLGMLSSDFYLRRPL